MLRKTLTINFTIRTAELHARLKLRTSACALPTLTFTDGLGREITLDGPAQRVVSLAPSNTEILFAIGAGDRLWGAINFQIILKRQRA